jgi:hypothetical protein
VVCSHMTCKKCKHEFCWVCMGSWSEHGTAWYSCNRFDEKSGMDARDAQSKSRASLERYLHVRPAPPQPSAQAQLTTRAVLQPMGKSRAVGEAIRGAVRQDGEEDGGDAGQHGANVDRGAIHEEGGRRGREVPYDAQVDVRDGVLPREGQREGTL